MAVVACDLFSQPAPEILNRIEVGTIGRQRDESETEFGGGSLNGLGPMPGGAVPNDHDCARLITQPFSHALQELNRMFFVGPLLQSRRPFQPYAILFFSAQGSAQQASTDRLGFQSSKSQFRHDRKPVLASQNSDLVYDYRVRVGLLKTKNQKLAKLPQLNKPYRRCLSNSRRCLCLPMDCPTTHRCCKLSL